MSTPLSFPAATGEFSWMALARRATFPLFCGLVLLLSIIISVITPPFVNPDEGAHYLRSYEVSRGHLVNTKGNVGVPMPCDEYLIVGSKYAPIAFFQDVTKLPKTGGPCTVRSVNSAGIYPPVSYVFSALGLRVGELFAMSPEHKLVTARMVNGLVSSALILFGLAMIRHYRLILASLLLMPTVMWQRSAITADAMTLTFCFLLMCCLIRIAETQSPPTRRHFALLCGLGLLLGSTKLVYSLLAFAALMFYWTRPVGMPRLKWLAMLASPGLIGIVASVAWLKLPDPGLFYLGNGADPSGQVAHALHHPLAFLETLYHTVANPGHAYSFVAAGFAGMDAQQAVSWYWAIFGLLFVTSKGLFTGKQRLVLLLVALAACAATLLPTYLTYTPVGYPEILGIQGRYFIPIVLFVWVAGAFTRPDWFYLRRPIRIGLGVLVPLLLLIHLIDVKG